MADIRVCPACQGHNSECPHCGGGGADDARQGLNVIGATTASASKRISGEQFEYRRAQNEAMKVTRERERMRAEEERRRIADEREQVAMRLALEKEREAERRARALARREMLRKRQMRWFGRIVDGTEPIREPLKWWEKIVWALIQ